MTSIFQSQFYDRLINIKKIAAIKEPKYLEKALEVELSAVVLSIGNIGVIKTYVDLFKSLNFPVFLHMERIGGISQDKEGINFIANYIKPTGIVSTRNNHIIEAKKHRLLTIQRVFLVDSDAIKSGLQSVKNTQPDAIELMPALVTELIAEFRQQVLPPIIAGGLIRTREQMIEAIKHGATAVSMGNYQLWRENLSNE